MKRKNFPDPNPAIFRQILMQPLCLLGSIFNPLIGDNFHYVVPQNKKALGET